MGLFWGPPAFENRDFLVILTHFRTSAWLAYAPDRAFESWGIPLEFSSSNYRLQLAWDPPPGSPQQAAPLVPPAWHGGTGWVKTWCARHPGNFGVPTVGRRCRSGGVSTKGLRRYPIGSLHRPPPRRACARSVFCHFDPKVYVGNRLCGLGG